MTKHSCTLHVCTSCRPSGAPREPREGRPGYKLYQELQAKVEAGAFGRQIEVRPAECLSLCPRPCGIALSSPGRWSYLFGDQEMGETSDDILDCVSLYLRCADGVMARGDRPPTLRASVLGRVSPK